MKVWVVHLDDAAPSSGFEGVFSSLDAAKRYVETQGASTEWSPPGETTEWRMPVASGFSWEAAVKGHDHWMRWYKVREEDVRD